MPRPSPELSPTRAQRLCRMLMALGEGPQHKNALVRKLKLEERGFFRDLRLMRQLGINVTANKHRYLLTISLAEAFGRLPLPRLKLSLQDALVLCNGSSPAHRRVRRSLEALIGPVDAFDGQPANPVDHSTDG